MGPHDKKHISKKYFDHRKSNIPKGPWGLGGRKFFVKIFKTNYIFGVHKGSSSRKTQK